MKTCLLTTLSLFFAVLFSYLYHTSVVQTPSSLVERSCSKISKTTPFEVFAKPYARLLRLKGNMPADTRILIGSAALHRSRSIPRKRGMYYLDIPASVSGPLTINSEGPEDFQVCISNYVSYSENNYIALLRDYPDKSMGNNFQTIILWSSLAVLILTSSVCGGIGYTTSILSPAALLSAGTIILSKFSPFKIYLSSGVFWTSVLILLVISLGAHNRNRIRHWLHRVATFHWSRPSFSERMIWGIAIVSATAMAYAPMFSHVFRHDEWFYFFTFRGDSHPLLKYIDWQLYLPHDRLIFRPLHHFMLATNMLLFGDNYFWPHVLSFIKHLTATSLLFLCLWEVFPHRIALIYAALFALLSTQVDAVSWPHVDAYIVSCILTLSAIYLFMRANSGKLRVSIAFTLSALILLAAMLTTELAFPIPLILFVAYWVSWRHPERPLGHADRFIFTYILTYPCWAALFCLHLWAIYPDFTMTQQSSGLPLIETMSNTLFISVASIVKILPLWDKTMLADKTYSGGDIFSFILLLAVMLYALWRIRKSVNPSKVSLLFFTLFIASWTIVGIARSTYINSLLNDSLPTFWIPTHYSYLPNALMVLGIYSSLTAATLRNPATHFTVILCLSFLNATSVNSVTNKITLKTAKTKARFDNLRNFVNGHKNEPEFGFSIIHREELNEPYRWYFSSFPETFYGGRMGDAHRGYKVYFDDQNLELRGWEVSRAAPASGAAPWEFGKSLNIPSSIGYRGLEFLKYRIQNRFFYISKTEVPWELWAYVTRTPAPREREPRHPATGMSWIAASQFVRDLNKITKANIYRLPSLEEMRIIADEELNKQERQKKEHVVQGRTICSWLENAIVEAIYIYPETPRLCAALKSAGSDTIFYQESYPPSFQAYNTGVRLVLDVSPRSVGN